MSNRLYDSLKFLAQVALPAVATLYFALAQIWGLPCGEEIVGTITAFNTFLGVLLRVNAKAYNNSDARYDGTLEVVREIDKKTFSLSINGDLDELDEKETILFKVDVKES